VCVCVVCVSSVVGRSQTGVVTSSTCVVTPAAAAAWNAASALCVASPSPGSEDSHATFNMPTASTQPDPFALTTSPVFIPAILCVAGSVFNKLDIVRRYHQCH